MATEEFGPEPIGATPLTDEDLLGLRPKWVANRADLNLAEAQNISQAIQKYSRIQLRSDDILDEQFVRKLHFDMFCDVWGWAGTYRKSETSIGVSPHKIIEDVYNLMENAKFWFRSNNAVEIDKTVCEIHHKLVQIHPFRNGNGRMTRLFADLLLVSLGRDFFIWGGGSLGTVSPSRSSYIRALQAADKGDISLLLEFVRSDLA